MKPPLKIGYLWQQQMADFSKLTASVLHIKAVFEGFKKQGHHVRMVTIPEGQYQWSDDLVRWQPAHLGVCQTPTFRLTESIVRGIQSRLRLPYFNYFDSYRFAQAAATALADCDVLYERYWLLNYGGLMAAKRLGVPLVLELNGDLFEEYEQLGLQLGTVQRTVVHLINMRLFHGASHIITVSEVLRQRTIERWRVHPTKITAVSNGAKVAMFAHSNGYAEARARFQLDDKPIVIFVGSFKPWHGLDLLVEAFGRVAVNNTDVRLVLVGDGPARVNLARQVHALNLQARVVFTGLVEPLEVASLLKEAEVAVLNPRVSPAASAQSPLKLFEYMAAGKAIVAPATANVTHILTHQENALLVPPGCPEALAGALIQLLEDRELRASLGQRASRQALERYSWDMTVSKLETVLHKLVR